MRLSKLDKTYSQLGRTAPRRRSPIQRPSGTAPGRSGLFRLGRLRSRAWMLHQSLLHREHSIVMHSAQALARGASHRPVGGRRGCSCALEIPSTYSACYCSCCGVQRLTRGLIFCRGSRAPPLRLSRLIGPGLGPSRSQTAIMC
jgi:hypothetical protein